MRLVPLPLVSFVVGVSVWSCGGNGSDPSASGGSGGENGDGDSDAGDGESDAGDGDVTGGDGDGSGGNISGDGDGDGDACVGDVTRCTDDENEVEICVDGTWDVQECSSSIPLCVEGTCDPRNCEGCRQGDQCHPEGANNPGNTCQVCDAEARDWSNAADGKSCGDHGSCDAGACACTDGWAGPDCGTCVVHVKAGGGDEDSGLSWGEALGSVQVALDLAAARLIDEGVDRCQVWVAEGTYKPGTELTSTFQLREHVELYGGFAGDETALSQRDWEEHETILSGDLSGDDSVGDLDNPANPQHRADNVYHLVVAEDDALLDGFVLRGGGTSQAIAVEERWGATLHVQDAEVRLNHCTITDNYALVGGSSIFIGDASLTMLDTAIVDNGGSRGVLVRVETSTLVMETGDVSDNRAPASISADHSDVTITAVTFARNEGNSGAGLDIHEESHLVVRDSTFNANVSKGNGGAIALLRSSADIVRASFGDNSAVDLTVQNVRGGALVATDSQVSIANSVFSDNSAQGGTTDFGGAIENWGGSRMEIFNTLFVGNAATTGAAVHNEADGTTLQVINSTFYGNAPSGTGGTLYNLSGAVSIANSILWNGGAPTIANSSSPTTETTVASSDVQGGYAGTGNLDVDPKFVDAADDDFHLAGDSPVLDQGDVRSLPKDALDLDNDGDVAEPLPVDLGGNTRVAGSGVDMGAYERPQ